MSPTESHFVYGKHLQPGIALHLTSQVTALHLFPFGFVVEIDVFDPVLVEEVGHPRLQVLTSTEANVLDSTIMYDVCV